MLLLLPSAILLEAPLLIILPALMGNAGSSRFAAAFDRFEMNFFCLEAELAALEADRSRLLPL